MKVTMATGNKNTDSFLPLAGLARDGWSNDKEATSTCLCGTVQLSFVRIAFIYSPYSFTVFQEALEGRKSILTRLLSLPKVIPC